MTAAKKPAAKKPATKPPPESEESAVEAVAVPEPQPPSSVDLLGADDRRIVRGWAESAARELAQKITLDTGEKLRIVPSEDAS